MPIDLTKISIPASRVVLGLSGGADSVALLLLLLQKGVDVACAHANFQLRGEESERDEDFVRQLCSHLGVKLFVKHFNTRDEAQSHGESIEMAARRLRYAWFETLCADTEAEAICTAHHRDDNIETFLLNLLRGSGLMGLTGMEPLSANHLQDEKEPAKRKYPILRPLLHIARADIEAYLRRKQQPYVTDSSNASLIHLRNRLRHELIPMLESINPAARQTIAETIQRLREAQYFYQQGVEKELSEIIKTEGDIHSIPVCALLHHPARLTLLHHALDNLFPTPMQEQIATLPEAQTGKHFRYKSYVCCRAHEAIEWSDITTPWCPERICSIDAEKIVGNLHVRPIKQGERFTPFGLHGTKLVSDFLADRHVSILRRMKARALCDDDGIVWLIGYEIAQRVACSPKTRKILTLTTEEVLNQ